MEEFTGLYSLVKGIVYKYRKQYVIRLWDKEDWDQEGMLSLYELLEAQPHLKEPSKQSHLLVYFKVKFGNRLKDQLRKQESQKRRFDRMPYEEVSEISHRLQGKGLINDEFIALREQLHRFKSSLGPTGEEVYQKLLGGERFKGRKALERDLRGYLSDFRG